MVMYVMFEDENIELESMDAAHLVKVFREIIEARHITSLQVIQSDYNSYQPDSFRKI